MEFKRFISFEGIDFSGKTTQIDLLVKRLARYGIHPEVVREPGGTTISEKIRDILLSKVHQEMHAITEILLYEAARAQLVHQIILPKLKTGTFIIADRFFDSTTCYQGFGRGLDLKLVHLLNKFATSGLKPFKTFFIDISPEVAETRKTKNKKRQDRLESAGIPFFERIRQGFLTLCKEDTQRFMLVNGEREPEKIAEEIWQTIYQIWIKPLKKS